MSQVGNVLHSLSQPVFFERGQPLLETSLEPEPTPTPEKVEEVATQVTNPDNNIDYRQRYIDLKKHYDTNIVAERKSDKAKIAELEEKLNSSVTSQTPKLTPEQFKAYIEEYPEVTKFMLTYMDEHLKNDPNFKELKSKQEEINKTVQEIENTKALNEILKSHPDAVTIKDSKEFADWYYLQDEDIQKLFNTTNPTKVVKGLNLYKAETGFKSPVQKREQQLNDSMEVDTKSSTRIAGKEGKIWKHSEINNPKIFEKFESEIEQAYREGRIDPNS